MSTSKAKKLELFKLHNIKKPCDRLLQADYIVLEAAITANYETVLTKSQLKSLAIAIGMDLEFVKDDVPNALEWLNTYLTKAYDESFGSAYEKDPPSSYPMFACYAEEMQD